MLVVKSFKPKNEHQHEEFLQLGRIGIWKAYGKHDPSRSQFSTTAYHFIRYEILRHLQKTKKQKIMITISDIETIQDNIKNLIEEYIPDNLSDIDKSILLLRLEGHSFCDIGQKIGKSRGYVNSRYKSIIQKIKNAN